jgi:protein-S-isoprenylcysteine O-methyltransferase Ste14
MSCGQRTVGLILTLVAVAFFLSAVRSFRIAGTPVPANRPATTIVRTGLYRFSRNPIYLAFSLFQLGIAIWVIRREEEYLERKFGAQYLDYKASVRRWL